MEDEKVEIAGREVPKDMLDALVKEMDGTTDEESDLPIEELVPEYEETSEEEQPPEESSEESETQEGEEEEAEQPDEAEPETWEADMDSVVELPGGEKVSVRELRQSYFRQKDYTEKTQELSEYRKVLEAKESKLKETETLADYLEENPQILQVINDIAAGDIDGANKRYQQWGGPSVGMQQHNAKSFKEDIQKEIQQELAAYKAELRLKADFERFLTNHPNADPNLILEEANRTKNPNFEAVYKTLYYDEELKKAKQEGHKETVQALKKGATAKSPKPSSLEQKEKTVDVAELPLADRKKVGLKKFGSMLKEAGY